MRRAASLSAILLTLSIAASGQQTSTAVERPIAVTAAGAQKLRVDLTLLAGARRPPAAGGEQERLADLRLADGANREIPYLLIRPPSRRPQSFSGTVLPIAETKTTSGFELDLGMARVVDAIDVDGLRPPFMKRVLLLEGSGDRARWTALAREGTVFDLPDERVRQTVIAFAAGSYRYLRVTWDDRSSGRLLLPVSAKAREGIGRPPIPPLREAVRVEPLSSEPGRSRYRLVLPAPGLPIAAIVLETGAGDVFRTATVLEPRFNGERADPVEIGRTRLLRTTEDAASVLRIPIEPPQGADLQLVIDNGNNPPLQIASVRVELADLPWIYFEAPSAGPYTARYGRTAPAPQYDLEAKRSAIDLDDVGEALWGEPRPGADAKPDGTAPSTPGRGASLGSDRFRYRRPIEGAGEGLVALQLDAAVLAHSKGPDSFADIRVVDGENYQIPYLLERRDEPLSLDLSVQPVSAEVPSVARPVSGHNSIYRLDLPYPALPADAIVIETSERVFRRTLRIGVERAPDRVHRDAWFEPLATAEWQHVDDMRAAPPLQIQVPSQDATRLTIVVFEGDNRALPITAARLLLPSWRVRFFRSTGPLHLVYGRDNLAPPQYDLALLAPAVLGADARLVTAAAESTDTAAPDAILAPRTFYIAIGVAVLILLALIAKLLRNQPTS